MLTIKIQKLSTIPWKQSQTASTYISSRSLSDCSFGIRDLCPRERNTLWIKSKVFLSCGGYTKFREYISPKSRHMASGRFSRSSISMTPSKMIAVFEASKCSACGESWLSSGTTASIPMEIWGVTFTVLIKKIKKGTAILQFLLHYKWEILQKYMSPKEPGPSLWPCSTYN